MKVSRLVLVVLALGGGSLRAGAQQAEPAPSGDAAALTAGTDVTLELVMSHPDWIGNAPEGAYWADDGQSIYYEQKRQGEEHSDLFRVGLDGEGLTAIEDEDRGSIDVEGGQWSRDRRSKIYQRAGDIYWKDVTSGEIRQLTRTADFESSPHFLLGERRVAFRRDSSVFVRDLDSGLEYQAADVQPADDPDEAKEPTDYLSRQQLRLLDWVREQKEEREAARKREEAAQSADASRVPPPWYVGKDTVVLQGQLSPDGAWILLAVADKNADRGRQDKMPNYVSEDGYVSVRDVRPKVGTDSGTGQRLLLLDLRTHRQHEIDLAGLPTITDDPLAEIKRRTEERRKKEAEDKSGAGDGDGDTPADSPAKGAEKAAKKRKKGKAAANDDDEPDDDKPAKPRAVSFFGGIQFSPDGRYAAIMVRSVDTKDRWIALLERPEEKNGDDDEEAPAPELRTIHHLHDEAWINWSFNDYGWLDDSRRIYYLSEESGYSQLYLYSLDDETSRRLTDGDFVVDDPRPGPDQKFFYYQANPEHPGIYEIYRVALESGESEQLTDLSGQNSAVVSPDGQHLLITHSTSTRPPELYVQPAWRGGEARRITHTVSEAFTARPWVAPQIVAVPSSHQERPIYSRFYPATGDATRGADGRSAAVVFVHGAGYLQNAHQGWSGYFREFMFHTFLTRQGYAVLDMDYRASAGYGRDWRTAIYRQMGTPEVEDLADGVAWLAENNGVDADRIGVYGGSYGGFLTFMAMFRRPELFACGAALRPVTDWAHYNHPYTANILNTPDVDPEAYERSSPIEYAEGLEKPLLICSGMQDDNVFFQDTVRLAQRLIELGKEDWEVAIYPIEAHGFVEPSSWLDEYRRIFKLFETHLK